MKNNKYQSVKKRILSALLAVVLAVSGITVTSVAQPEVAEAALLSYERNVSKADSATAKWIDKKLRDDSGNDLELYVKNQKSTAAIKKIMTSLQAKVKKMNSYGFTFTYTIGKFNKKSTNVTIAKFYNTKSDNALFGYLNTAQGFYGSANAFSAEVNTYNYAKQLDAKLKDYSNFKKMTWLVKGSKADVKQVVKQLEAKIQTTNKDGVVFQYDLQDVASDKKWYVVTVTKSDAKLYYYSNKFIDKVWEDVKLDATLCEKDLTMYQKIIAAQTDDSVSDDEYLAMVQEYESLFDNESYEDTIFSNLIKENNEQRQLIINTQNFCDLSSAMKLFVTSAAGCWNMIYYHKNMEGLFLGIRYDDGDLRNSGHSDWENMKLLGEGKRVGVCEDYARSEILVMEQLGIPCYYACGGNHAWSVAKVTNSDGDSWWQPNDYGVGTWSGYSEDLERNSDKLYLQGIKDSKIRSQALAEMNDKNSLTGNHDATDWN